MSSLVSSSDIEKFTGKKFRVDFEVFPYCTRVAARFEFFQGSFVLRFVETLEKISKFSNSRYISGIKSSTPPPLPLGKKYVRIRLSKLKSEIPLFLTTSNRECQSMSRKNVSNSRHNFGNTLARGSMRFQTLECIYLLFFFFSNGNVIMQMYNVSFFATKVSTCKILKKKYFRLASGIW